MKSLKIILTVFSIFLLYSFAYAQGNCPGGKIKVYKGASGCGCHCQKECVTPAELPVYLANGWNTTGCWNCCFGKNWVDAGNPKSSHTQFHAETELVASTTSFMQTSDSEVNITVTDMTGRQIDVPGYLKTEDNELIWDQTGLSTGMYILNVQTGGYTENKIVSIVD